MTSSHSLLKNRNIVKLRRERDADGISEVCFNRKPLDRLKVLHEQCETSLNIVLSVAFLFHFTKPGKMLRAQLAMQSARAHSADAADADRWGFAVELIHNASLIHDDICDSDLIRRGRQSVMAKFGQQTALCLGDALIAHAFGLLSRESIPRALIAKLASMVRDCSGGQAQEFDTRGYPDWSRYCDIAGGKTASLLVGAVEGGALFDPAVSENPLLSKCCYHMALAYQMLNDWQNVVSSILSISPSSDFSKALSISFKYKLQFSIWAFLFSSSSFFSKGENQKAKVKIILDYQAVPGVSQYRVQYRKDNGNFVSTTITLSLIHI